MSPELFDPKKFGLKHSRPTKYSDCYALGMVIYEVLSGLVPFSHHTNYAVAYRVLEGERPGRPQGAGGMWFTDDIWRISERCWVPERDDRASVQDVLQVLEEASSSWTERSPRMVADSPTTGSPTRNSSDQSTKGSTEESDTSSPSQVAPVRTLPPKGDADGKWLYPLLLTRLQLSLASLRITRASGRM